MSLRLKTIIGIGLIEAVLLVILISTVLNYMRNISYTDMQNYIETTTTLFSTATQDAVLSQDLATLDTFVEEILKNKSVLYAKIIDSENITLSEGGDPALLNTSHTIDNTLENIDDNIYNAQKNITIDEEVYGTVNIGFSTIEMQIALDNTQKMAGTIAIVEMILVAFFSFILGIYLTKQLNVLRKSAIRIADGNLDRKIIITGKDEIADVAKAFNKMMDNLKLSREQTKEYQDQLIVFNQELEARVERRTEQLSHKNHELESAYEKLQTTQEQLVHSEKLASIGQLAAGVAHEINNPVAFIKGNLNALSGYVKSYQNLIQKQQEIIKQHADIISANDEKIISELNNFTKEEDIEFITEDITTLLEESIGGTDRVSDIVKGLKIYSRGHQEKHAPININQCLNDTLRMVNNEIKYKCEIITAFQDLPSTIGDEGKLSQVFTNLIMNASQAITDKGKIKISTLFKEQHNHIVIRDTGKGISPENLKYLFDPFFTTKAVGEGTGLGLSISEGIIEDHGGTIRVRSKLGIGTEFVIRLPVIP